MEAQKNEKAATNNENDVLTERQRRSLEMLIDTEIENIRRISYVKEVAECGSAYLWKVRMAAPDGTPYEGGVYELVLGYSRIDPIQVPVPMFQTAIYHPNITRDGKMVSSQIQGNTQCVTTFQMIQNIYRMLKSADVFYEVNPEAYNLYFCFPHRFNKIAKAWTSKYARPIDANRSKA